MVQYDIYLAELKYGVAGVIEEKTVTLQRSPSKD